MPQCWRSNACGSTVLRVSPWQRIRARVLGRDGLAAGPGSDVDHAHPLSVHVSQQFLRPEPMLTELLIHPLHVIRFQWGLGGSRIVDSAATVGAAVVGLIEYPL